MEGKYGQQGVILDFGRFERAYMYTPPKLQFRGGGLFFPLLSCDLVGPNTVPEQSNLVIYISYITDLQQTYSFVDSGTLLIKLLIPCLLFISSLKYHTKGSRGCCERAQDMQGCSFQDSISFFYVPPIIIMYHIRAKTAIHPPIFRSIPYSK